MLVHEFAHVLGFTTTHHNAGVTGVSNECAIHLGSDSTINSSVCQHEVEWLYSGYGIGPSTRPSDFWSKPIVTGLNASPTSVTLNVDGTQQISVTQLLFARSQQPSTNLGSTNLSWSTDNVAIASVNAAGLIRGEGAGSTTVRAKIGTGLPPSYQVGTIMGADGEPIHVTVNPPGGGFRVTAINGVIPPITSPGTRTLTATVVNKPGTTLQLRWEVDYSNTAPNPDTVTSWGLNSYRLRVEEGSYNIRVKATPRSDAEIGTAAVRDYPVCTDGGGGVGEFSRADKPGDPGTNAVGGC
ncbi:MAG: hypothetical protein HKM89_05885 [Gemmatimonadales bacterium]|nr:hypothetical protein [Gemmatimonadales bacterium]